MMLVHLSLTGDNTEPVAGIELVDNATAGTVPARQDAVDKARAKVQEYAELLGVELGEVVYLTELSAPTNIVVGTKADAMAESASTVFD